MTTPAKSCSSGYHTITPALSVRGGLRALDFYRQAFGAEERKRLPGPDGQTLMHAEIRIGDSTIMLSEEDPTMDCRGPQSLARTTVSLYLYVPDVDAAFKQTLAAGAKSLMPVAHTFWGDRMGKLADPFRPRMGAGYPQGRSHARRN